MLRNCVVSFFQSHLDYKILNWSCGHISNLKRALTSSSSESFKTQKILIFENFRKYNISKFMWELYHMMNCPKILEMYS